MEIDKEKYTDRLYLKWIDQPSHKGWQFSFERPVFPESKFFNIKAAGSVDAAYQKAIAYRDEFLKAAAELGIFDLNSALRLPVILRLNPRNTSGIVGVHRSSYDRADRKKAEINWIAGYKDKNGVQRQKKFSVQLLTEKYALYNALKFRRDYVERVYNETTNLFDKSAIENHIIELEILIEYVAGLNDEADIFFFLSTINNPLLGNTEKQDMLAVRIGQQRFRKLVTDFWEGKCAITGAKLFLTAAHIKPWCLSNNHERLDVFNGLTLSPLYDKAFDAGYISFADDGKIIINEKLKGEAHLLGISGEEKIEGITPFHLKYLEYHRETIFKP